MNAFDFNAVVIGCDVYCLECAPSHTDDEASPVFANSEWDYYPVCDRCGREHDYVIKIEDKHTHTRTDPDDLGIERCPVCNSTPDYSWTFDVADENGFFLREVTPCAHTYVIDCINGFGVWTTEGDRFVIGLTLRGERLTYAESLRPLP